MADREPENMSRAMLEERLKAAVWYATGNTVDEISASGELQIEGAPVNATPAFVAGLANLVWQQAEVLAQDLENFAHHAGRKHVTVQDVKLCSRRNEGLEAIMTELANEIEATRGKGSKKRTR